MYAYNIEWEVSMDDVLEKFDELDIYAAGEALEMPAFVYGQMTQEERHEAICNYFRHRHGSCKADFMELPDATELGDDDGIDESEAMYQLEQEYGFCVSGLELR